MTVKYFGNTEEKGLTLVAIVYDTNGQLVGEFTMTEVSPNSAIYISEDFSGFDKGVYIVRIVDNDEFLGHTSFIWDGIKEVTLADINSWSIQEQMEIRDALGVSGDKSVAIGGQLQKKSEYPYNNIIDTNDL